MSPHTWHDSTISDTEELDRYTADFIAKFKDEFPGDQELDVHYTLHDTRAGFPRAAECENPSPVFREPGASRCNIHLYQPALIGIPTLALQGWLDLELASHVLNFRPEAWRFNFRREILPLIDVSGMAVQVMRYLVSHLERGLKQATAIQMVLDMAHGRPLLYYYYLNICPSQEDQNSYQHLVPHHWTRAIFICKKSGQHAAVALLARQGLFTELTSYWWACHDYILPEDRNLMEELADISHKFREMRFSEQLVAMFQTVKTHLL